MFEADVNFCEEGEQINCKFMPVSLFCLKLFKGLLIVTMSFFCSVKHEKWKCYEMKMRFKTMFLIQNYHPLIELCQG